jgi:hypothetical protein
MATITMERTATAIEPKIKMAMENIGLGERADDLLDMLDEIELGIELQKGVEQIEKGETLTLQEFEKQMNEKVANGFYRS